MLAAMLCCAVVVKAEFRYCAIDEQRDERTALPATCSCVTQGDSNGLVYTPHTEKNTFNTKRNY